MNLNLLHHIMFSRAQSQPIHLLARINLHLSMCRPHRMRKCILLLPHHQNKKRRSKEVIKGSRGSSDHISIFLKCFQLYIMHVKDEGAYDNYGFRIIASIIGMGEDGQPQVRHYSSWELSTYLMKYDKLFHDNLQVDKFLHSLNFSNNLAIVEKWMVMLNMMHVIVFKYNVVVHISMQQGLAFLHLWSMPLVILVRKIISTNFANDNHFVKVMS